MKKRTLLPGLVMLSGLAFLQACSESPRTIRAVASQAPVAVQQFSARLQDVPSFYTATGTVHASVESQVASQIMARVLAVRVHTGDRVQRGQTLIMLDAQETDAAFRKAEANRAEVQTAIQEGESNITAAKANLDLTSVTVERMNDLYSKRSVSKQEYDEASARWKGAQANYDAAQARRAELTNRLAESNAALQEAQVSKSYRVLQAPFGGVITSRTVEPGTLAIPGNVLLTLEAGDEHRLHADVEESHLSLVHSKGSVAVVIDGRAEELPGRVGEISPTSDSHSHSYVVKIDLPPSPTLHSGQFGHVSFAAGSRRAMTVPTAAVFENGQLQSVFVNENGLARTRLITLGEKKGGSVEVLSGIQPGELVICPIPSGLADGDKVEARQ